MCIFVIVVCLKLGLSYYNIPLGVSLTEAMRLANNKIKCFHVTFEHITFYRRLSSDKGTILQKCRWAIKFSL